MNTDLRYTLCSLICDRQNIDLFDYLLRSYTDTKYDRKLLFEVAKSPAFFHILLGHEPDLNLKDIYDNTILHVCSFHNFMELLDILPRNFNYNAKNKGGIPILIRLLRDNFPASYIQRFLSLPNVDVDIQDNNGQNAYFHIRNMDTFFILKHFGVHLKRDIRNREPYISLLENYPPDLDFKGSVPIELVEVLANCNIKGLSQSG